MRVMGKRESLWTLYKIFVLIVFILVVVGFVFVYSSSSVYALERCGSASYYLKKQVIGFAIGLLLACGALWIKTEVLSVLSPLLFFISLCFTGLSLVPHIGVAIHGSSRWVSLAGVSFQPSELLKYAFLLYVAHVVSAYSVRRSTIIRAYVLLLASCALVALLLLAQPDFGLMVTLCATACIIWFLAFVQWGYLLMLLGMALPVFGYLIYQKPYRLRRLLSFLDPWKDAQGAGFQVIQSLIAIGSGGFWGLGISHSRQKFFYLPMQHTDFIVSIIAEETGFIGMVLLVSCFVALLYVGMKIAWQLTNSFATYVTLGFVILLSLQAVINISVVAGLFPTKGIGLPFVSYGNSSLVCAVMMVGVIGRCVHEELRRSRI
jgi:cell division protein FtsW